MTFVQNQQHNLNAAAVCSTVESSAHCHPNLEEGLTCQTADVSPQKTDNPILPRDLKSQ